LDNLVLAAGEPDDTATIEDAAPELILTAAASNGAVLAGLGKVVAGGMEITGGDASDGWTADGATGTVTIAENSITGSGTGETFTAGAENSGIKVTAAELEVGSVVITLAEDKGKVTLVGGNPAGSLLLKGGGANAKGSLVVDSESSDTLTIGSSTTVIGADTPNDDASVTGSSFAATGGDDDDIATGTPLGSISGGANAGDNDATITGPTAADKNSVIAYGLNIKSE
jgi:hypothetical protein